MASKYTSDTMESYTSDTAALVRIRGLLGLVQKELDDMYSRNTAANVEKRFCAKEGMKYLNEQIDHRVRVMD